MKKVFLVLDGGLEDIWLLPLMKDFFSSCCQNSSTPAAVRNPPARIGIQLGSEVRALPASQRRGVITEDCVHLQAEIKPTSLGFDSSSSLVSCLFLIAASAQLR